MRWAFRGILKGKTWDSGHQVRISSSSIILAMILLCGGCGSAPHSNPKEMEL